LEFLSSGISIEETEFSPILDMTLDENLGIFGIRAGSARTFIDNDSLWKVDYFETLLADTGTPIQILGIHEQIIVQTSCSFIGFT
jgi:hypothetical protein